MADSADIVLGPQDEIRRLEESRYDQRLHGVLPLAQGVTCPQVARLSGDAAHDRALGSPFRSPRAGGSPRRGASGAVEPIARATTEAGDRRPAAAGATARTGGEPVGWQAPIGASATGVRREAGSAAVPASVPPVWISPAETSPDDCAGGPGPTSRRKETAPTGRRRKARTFGLRTWSSCPPTARN